jgi:pimeloyl-ACP methyl ester carboxylesterase
MQVVVHSLLTEYSRTGKGKTIVVLHGWADSGKGWAKTSENLSQNYDVIVPDLPGFGGTELPPAAWGLDDYAGFVGEFLAKLKVKPDVIIGHSNGGAIAVRGMAQGLFSTGRLVLLDSAGIRSEYLGRKKALRYVTKTGKILTKPLPGSVKKRLRRKVYEKIGSDMLIAERLQDTFKKVVTDDVQADAATLKIPTLLIYGADDLDTPVQYGRMFHTLIPGSKFEVIPGAGHFAHRDKPEQVIKLITEFIK